MSIHGRQRPAGGAGDMLPPPLQDRIEDCEIRVITLALEEHRWNQRRAAASLGLRPAALLERMKRLGLLRGQPRSGKAGRAAATQPRRRAPPF